MLAVIAAAATLIMATAAMAEPSIIGRAFVVDGDTIEIHGERIRLNGIDAPESWQTCIDRAGAEYRCEKASAEALDAFLAASRPTRCDFVERDRYGRFVGVCRRTDGVEVNSWLVRTGNALDWPRYSHGAYAGGQAKARAGRLGMWQGDFVEPWTARAQRR